MPVFSLFLHSLFFCVSAMESKCPLFVRTLVFGLGPPLTTSSKPDHLQLPFSKIRSCPQTLGVRTSHLLWGGGWGDGTHSSTRNNKLSPGVLPCLEGVTEFIVGLWLLHLWKYSSNVDNITTLGIAWMTNRPSCRCRFWYNRSFRDLATFCFISVILFFKRMK